MRRSAIPFALLAALVGACTGEATTSRGAVERTEVDESSEGSSDDEGAVQGCESANDRALCLVQALDGPTEKEPLLALINAHEELGNRPRAGQLKARYIALFDDATASLFARDLPAEAGNAGGEETDLETAEREPDAPSRAATGVEPEPEAADPEAPVAEASGSMQMANPLMECATEPNYSACIMREVTRPSTAREYEALINAYKETGQRRRACSLMEQVIQRYPSSPAARRFGQQVQRSCQ